MFYGCTKLNSINVNFSVWNPTNATSYWVLNVASSGTFTCPTALPEEFGASRIPTGWTIVRK
jgi:surface protein